MLSPPDSPVEQQQKQSKKNPVSHLLENISSYDGNVMLAAVISLLLVILFVLLLHIYAKWFLQQARHRRRRRSRNRSRRDPSMSISMSNMLRPAGRFHHFHNFPFDDNNSSTPNSVSSKGLEASTIASIPLFVYCSNNNNGEDDGFLECVVCLSVFEESDVCRCLPKCGHSFHVECIDMWLHSHTNCPICRAPVVSEKIVAMDIVHDNDDDDSVEAAAGPELVEIVVVVNVEQQQGRESSNCEISGDHDQIQDVGLLNHDRSSSSSSSASSGSSSLGSSLKRMLSRNSRSDHHQSKVFPSSSDHHNNPNIVELDGS